MQVTWKLVGSYAIQHAVSTVYVIVENELRRRSSMVNMYGLERRRTSRFSGYYPIIRLEKFMNTMK